jgi:hypothetical protein
MGLHARAVALAAGATGARVERVATMIVEARNITIAAALEALALIETGVDETAKSAPTNTTV